MDLIGKNVVISGGMSGIGLGTCKQLMNANISRLAILDLIENQKIIEELRQINLSVKILFIKTDVTSKQNVENSFDKILKEFSTIDIVLCNAGRMGESQIEETIQVNFLGIVYMTLAAMRLMSKSNGKNGGVIMATASVAGLGSTCFNTPMYNASKFAVIGFYRSLSNDFYFNKHNIKFILICPGLTETPMANDVQSKVFDADAVVHSIEFMQTLPVQSADTMGKLMIEAIKIGENGSTWIGEDGKLSRVEFNEYWP